MNKDTAIVRLSRRGKLYFQSKPPGFPELSDAKLNRMRRSIADSFDPTRYIIVSPIGRSDVLCYRTEDSSFCSHISMATLFKNQEVAEAVRGAIFGQKLQERLKVVRVKKTKSGVRLVGRSELEEK
jgi:hypothetical protein